MKAQLDMKSSPYYYEEYELNVDVDDHLIDRVTDNKNAKLVEPLN
jgi:hypothetical protein